MDYYGTYPLNPSLIRGYKPPYSSIPYCAPPGKQLPPLNSTLHLGYWELLAPALCGTAGALFLSLCSDTDPLIERCGGTLFKLAIVSYAIGASVAVFFAVIDVVVTSKAPHKHLLYPIIGALISIILLFTSEYFLLYRFFPDSFKGEIGDNFCTQLFSFLYLSTTTLATAGLGDIMPSTVTARALIATEIAFNLFTLATGIQLLLFQKN